MLTVVLLNMSPSAEEVRIDLPPELSVRSFQSHLTSSPGELRETT